MEVSVLTAAMQQISHATAKASHAFMSMSDGLRIINRRKPYAMVKRLKARTRTQLD